ncbi:MAG: cache domain-containing protein, partial [Ktedonobacteraceae bacterium]|nr:cache domain-containing protein [Ktedonobacteraceae bacterium]
MQHFVRRSLLVQLLSVYLLFVVVVLLGGVGVNAVVEQKLRNDVQASDQALAQEIALQTNIQMTDTEEALVGLGRLAQRAGTPEAMANTFQTFQAARSDVDQVYWLDAVGIVRISCPPLPQTCNVTSGLEGVGSEFAPPTVVQQALVSTSPVFEVGIAVETTRDSGVIIAEPVRTLAGQLIGIVAASISLKELSNPLTKVIQAQRTSHRQLMISIIDSQGWLIATPDDRRILYTVLDELPGAEQALHNHTTTSSLGPGPDGQDWLFSAVPVPDVHWAVVVQRPAAEALSVVIQFQFWLLTAALLFAIGGLLFW